MSDQERKNIVELIDYLAQSEVLDLYNRHDKASNLQLGIDQETGYSECGQTLIDDFDYFLTHPQYRQYFEKIFQEHLKDFSMLIIKGD